MITVMNILVPTDYTKDHNMDLIVMGTHGRGALPISSWAASRSASYVSHRVRSSPSGIRSTSSCGLMLSRLWPTRRSDIVAKAVELSETLGKTNHRHAFEHAVRDFVGLLAAVPDCPISEFAVDDIASLGTEAEGVIARIEQRLITHDDSGAVQPELLGAVYEIRKRLEQIHQWWAPLSWNPLSSWSTRR